MLGKKIRMERIMDRNSGKTVAEVIRLTRVDGSPVSLVDLKDGSEVLVYRESAGRHFGVRIDETIVER